MAQNIVNDSIKERFGCLDPMATNYDPLATAPCGGCCTYEQSTIVGCTDPSANNYDPSATIPCGSCCEYGVPQLPQLPEEDIVGDEPSGPTFNPGGFSPAEPLPEVGPAKPCDNLVLSVTLDGVVLDGNGNTIPQTCCTKAIVGNDVVWDTTTTKEGVCRLTSFVETPNGLCDLSGEELDNRVICIDCDNFSWWNNLYISLNGSSLQDHDPALWNYLVEVIETTDGSFYADSLTGDIIVNQVCCDKISGSNFSTITDDNGNEVSACLCEVEPPTPIIGCECVDNIETFIQYASTELGSTILLSNETLVGGLGLTEDEALFVSQNLYNTNDDDGNGVPDDVDSRTIIANALFVTGGIFVCFETDPRGNLIKTKPVQTTSNQCEIIGGYWTGTACLCEVQETCDLEITQLQITTQNDLLGNPIEVITFEGETISEVCCTRIASENNVNWVYTEGLDGVERCYRTEPRICPVNLQLNETPITADCPNAIEVSASIYFSRPENPCQPYPDPDDDGGVIIPDDGEPCVLTFDDQNNLVEVIDVQTKKGVSPLNSLPDFFGTRPQLETTPTEPCCYNSSLSILGRLIIETETEETFTSLIEFNSEENGFDEWVTISTELLPSETLGEFNVILEFYQGLNCCCVYDIFIDNLKVSCRVEEVIVEDIIEECPGFDIQHVIDNKKSWVYNPGIEGYSNIPEDDIINQYSEKGLIQGYGTINRDFSPSADSELPWRYTDYWNQSSTLEKHSNLVLNSKELFLTFNMCNVGKPCPNGYTVSGDTCVKPICPSGYTHNEGVCYSGGTSGLTATTVYDTIKLGVEQCKSEINLLQLESYKKSFQGFWVQFIEQFVPATTIFVSGEKWCNRPEDICTIYDPCDFDFEFVEGDVTTTPNEGGWDFEPAPSDDSGTVDPESNDPQDGTPIDPGTNDTTGDGPILTEGGPKIIPLDPTLGLNSSEPVPIDITEEEQQRVQNYKDRLNSQPTETIIL